jgi:hypothetical protein
MPYYSNPRETHPWDEPISVANNKAFTVHQLADSRGIIVDPFGSSSAATATSAFGEGLVAQLSPVLQLDGIYGFDSEKFEQYSAFGGTVGVDKEMSVSTSTSPGSYAVLRSRRAVRYRSGQGAVCRFTAAFTTGIAGYTQRAGFFTQEQALQIGYDGERFGILRLNGGKAHIHSFTITTAATSAGAVTVTLNGIAYTANVTTGTTTQNAKEIASTSFPGWLVEQVDNEVRFLSEQVGPLAGAFSISGSGVVATGAVLQTGVAHTQHWTYQEDFNIDKLDGTGPSEVNLDTTKLNVYQINFRWLGAGEIRFAVEDPNNGNMVFFHHIHYTNRERVVHLDNPSLKVGYVVANTSGIGGSAVEIVGGSMMGAIEGNIIPTTYPVAARGYRSGGMNTINNVYHLLTIKNPIIYNSKINTRELLIQSISALATIASSAPGTMFVYINPTLGIDLTFNSFSQEKAALYSTTTTTINATLNTPIAAFSITSAAPQFIDLSSFRIAIPPQSCVSVGFVSGDNINTAEVNVMFIED